METNIALIATGYLLTRLGVAIAFGYLVYRALRPKDHKADYQPAFSRTRDRQREYRFDR